MLGVVAMKPSFPSQQTARRSPDAEIHDGVPRRLQDWQAATWI